MAKQLVNPIERHVEKAIVGVAGLILIGAIYAFLVTSPNQLELGGETVTPSSIDEKVAQKAATVRDLIRQARVRVEMPDPLADEFTAKLDPFQSGNLTRTIRAGMAQGPDIPVVDRAGTIVGGAKLVGVLPPTNAVATTGRSTYRFGAFDEVRDVVANWVTVSAAFDVKQQMEEQALAYGHTRKDVFFGPVELQRRMRRDDGTWSEGDWTPIEPYRPPVGIPPEVPEFEIEDDQGELFVSREGIALVDRFDEEIRDSDVQLALIRPLMPDIVNGDSWDPPIITTLRDILMQDDQYLYPEDEPATEPENRYSGESNRRKQADDTRSIAETTDEDLKRAEAMIKDALKTLNENASTRAYNLAFEVVQSRTTSGADRVRAQRIMQQAEQAAADIRRKLRSQGQPGKQGGKDAKKQSDEPTRKALPSQQIWFHDAEPDSLVGGRTYQYRIRATLYNRLLAQPDKLLEPQDATKAYAVGDWSDPVETTIAPSTLLFFTSQDERNSQVRAEFFQWFEGNWFKFTRKFKVGQELAATKRLVVPTPDGGESQTESAPIPFDAGGSVVDIDFSRPHRERKRGASRDGVKFGAKATACSVVFSDPQGRLFERFVDIDRSHPDKRNATQRLWIAPKGK